jgi:hypothetical protein
MMEIEDVSVQIFYGELPYSPGLQFQRIDNVGAEGLQFLVGGFDIDCKEPENGRFEGRFPHAEEDRCFLAEDGTNAFVWV